MALHPHQVGTSRTISGSLPSRIYGEIVAAVDGTLALIRHDSDTDSVFDSRFYVYKNGTLIYPTEGDAPVMLNGTNSVEDSSAYVTGTSIAKGDRLTFKASTSGSFGRVGGKLYSTVYIEDGQPTKYKGTSVTSFTIGTGSKAFETQKNLGYGVGTRVRVSSDADPAGTFMEGTVTAYSGTTLTVLVDVAVGTGTHTDWTINLTGREGAQGPEGDPGPTGNDGIGVPSGGTTGQVLAKNSNTDYDTEWIAGGGGASDLDDLTDVTITSPTSGQVLKYDGTVWKNDTDGGGGGGSVELFSPDCPYATPGSYDDEFNAGTLDAKWTSFLTGGDAPTFDHTSIPNHIGIKGTSDGKLCGITQNITPSGDFVIGCKVQAPAALDTYKRPRGGIIIYDASGVLVFGFVRNANARYLSLYKTNDITTFWAATKVNDLDIWAGSDYLLSTHVYLRIKYTHSSKSCDFEYSFDGVNWNDFYVNNTYGSGAATKIGVAVDKYNSTSNTMCYFDWFRVMQGATFGRNYSVT